MKLNKNKKLTDRVQWRCKKNLNIKHDYKVNIRKGSLFYEINTDLRIIYFIIFYNFVNYISIKQIFRNCKEFTKDLKIKGISRQYISKIHNLLRTKIMKEYHKYWGNNLMGMEPGDDGKSRLEIDESKMVCLNGRVFWIFGIVDRNKYDIRLFFVKDNRQKETILPIIVKNVFTPNAQIIDNTDNDIILCATRIYSDCWASYQINDFNRLGFILYRVNHSQWFGQGNFHTNTVEGVWSQLKRLTHNFNGINGKLYYSDNIDEINTEIYFNSWICYGLFFMKCEKLNIGLNKKKELLLNFLKLE